MNREEAMELIREDFRRRPKVDEAKRGLKAGRRFCRHDFSIDFQVKRETRSQTWYQSYVQCCHCGKIRHWAWNY